MKFRKIVYGLVITTLILVCERAYGEEILVTLTENAGIISFDGRWSFEQEWKQTSENIIHYDDGSQMAIRTVHDYNNLYVFLDFITDTSILAHADKAIICLDGKNDSSERPQSDDYCFMIMMGSNNPKTIQGGNILASTGFLKTVGNHPALKAVGGVSDIFDRYSKTSHSSYELKIPLEIIGKSDIYGFYIGVYDADKARMYSWPQGISSEKYPFIPFPYQWGKLISPDKSIPEFNFPFFTFIIVFTITVLITTRKIGLI